MRLLANVPLPFFTGVHGVVAGKSSRNVVFPNILITGTRGSRAAAKGPNAAAARIKVSDFLKVKI